MQLSVLTSVLWVDRAAHYHAPCDVIFMQRFINQVAYRFSRPVKVIEWGCWRPNGTVQHAAAFMRQAMALMDSGEWVLRCGQAQDTSCAAGYILVS